MSRRTAVDLSNEWIAYFRRVEANGGRPLEGEFGPETLVVAHEQPEFLWSFILEVVKATEGQPQDMAFEMLAAGPLEDLLTLHGRAFIDRVEQEAARNSRFRSLLPGVWQNTTPDDVWARVRACCVRNVDA
jgi:hypothetical protein